MEAPWRSPWRSVEVRGGLHAGPWRLHGGLHGDPWSSPWRSMEVHGGPWRSPWRSVEVSTEVRGGSWRSPWMSVARLLEQHVFFWKRGFQMRCTLPIFTLRRNIHRTGGLGLNIYDYRKDHKYLCYYVRRRGLPILDVTGSIITTDS